jgi:hypothetical protein
MSMNASGEAFAAVRRLVTSSGGRMVRRPMFRDRHDPERTVEEPEPLAGIRAAAALEHEARQVLAGCARYAREDGLSWEQIGEALLAAPAPGEPSRAVAAFDRLAWSYDQWQAPTFTWTCPSCLRQVLDHGPEAGGHPSETEEGHADGCARLAAAIDAWNAQWEDDE